LPTRRSAVLYLQFPGNNRLKLISLNSLRKFVTIAALASSTIHAAEPESLDRTLEPYLKEFGLLALAAAVFKEGVVIASGVTGTRRAGQDIPVGIEDRFHIGSDSKAFTSLLAGQFVEEGKLRWDSARSKSVIPKIFRNAHSFIGFHERAVSGPGP
jgi:CubicO group peptidase (beta-lactamase class C family)